MQDMKATQTAAAPANLYRVGTASALALGAGLAGLSEAQATVILTDVNATITDGFQTFDVNDDGDDELGIQDDTNDFSRAKGFYGLLLSVDDLSLDKPMFLNRFDFGDTVGISTFVVGSNQGDFYRKEFFSKAKGGKIDTKGKSPWEDGKRGFFGFVISKGKLGNYFGYVEAQFSPGNTVNIFRIGFEDELNTPITIRDMDVNEVPAPGGIGLLALGAAGILAYRRRQRKQAASA